MYLLMKILPWLRVCFKCVERPLEVRTEILLVATPHDGPVNAQSDLDEDQNIGGDIKDSGCRLVPHRKSSAPEQAHAEYNDADDHQDHGQNRNDVI